MIIMAEKTYYQQVMEVVSMPCYSHVIDMVDVQVYTSVTKHI